ncbi:hypothetical protein Tco_0873290 [Tanacetum coccineum]
MAAVEVPQTLEYMGGQLNAAPVLEQNKGLIAETYDCDEEEVSSEDNEVTEVKALKAMPMKKYEQIPTQKKKILGIDQLTEDTSSSRPKDLVFVKSSSDNSKVSIAGSNKPKLSEAEDSTLSNHDTSKHPLPPLEKLTGAKPVSKPKTIKSILKSKSTFKAETLKCITINEPSSAPARGNKSSSASKTNSAPAGSSQCTSKQIQNSIKMNCELKREALQAKKVESFKASKTESSSALRSKTPTKR